MARKDPIKYRLNPKTKSKKWHKARLFDLMVLIANVWMANEDQNIGFEDADQTINELTQKMNYEVWTKMEDIESALWACNLLDEKGKFWHPRKYGFEEFVKVLLGHRTFNRVYNLVDFKTRFGK